MAPEHPSAEPSVVERAVTIHATADEVWGAVLDPERGPRWLGGFRFESSWQVGSPLAIVGTLNGRRYREVGTLLAFEPPRRLRYDHWSRLWRVPDAAGNRAVWTLTLEPREAGTLVTLRHDLPAVTALAQHSAFFWRGALEQLRRMVEG